MCVCVSAFHVYIFPPESVHVSFCVWLLRMLKNMGGRPPLLNPHVRSTFPNLSQSLLPVTLQTSQLFCFFTVKVLTHHERCQYRGPLIRVWLTHESCHTCVCSELAWPPKRCVRDGRPAILARGKLMVGQTARHTRVLSDRPSVQM